MHVGRVCVQVGDAPLPEGQRLGVGVVDAEDAHAAVDPELEDGAQLVPEALPVGGLEVERIDVLIFLWRVLGVLDGAVGAMEEPLGMLLDPGMVGRALEGDVERELHAVGCGWRRRGGRSRRRCRAWDGWLCGRLPLSRWPRGCPRRPGRRWWCCWGLCGRRGRWGGWAAGRGCRSPWRRSRAAAARRRRRCRGALGSGEACERGKELVPAGEARALAVDPEGQLVGGGGGVAEVGVARGQCFDLRGERVVVDGEFLVGRARAAKRRALSAAWRRLLARLAARPAAWSSSSAPMVRASGNVLRRQIALGGVGAGGVGLGGEALLQVVRTRCRSGRPSPGW